MQTQFETEENQYKIEHIVEASLFMANKPLSFEQLCQITKTNEDALLKAIESLKTKYEESEHAIEILINNETKTVTMQVATKWLPLVASLTEKIELAKKSTKFLALIAKKGELLQSDLRKYFKGDIYEYVGELREKGYLERTKKGHSWILKPTKKFHEEFQITVGEIPEPQQQKQEETAEEKSEKNATTT
ncbi:MAG: SMC-Scp complex subunit ScpB [Candidatus Micrarchaeota archaeon]